MKKNETVRTSKPMTKDDKATTTRNEQTKVIKPHSFDQKVSKSPDAATPARGHSKVEKQTNPSVVNLNEISISSIVTEQAPRSTKKKGTSLKDKKRIEELEKRIKETEELLKQERDEKKKIVEHKTKEIENKEKVIFSIAGTNRKLMTELEDLKKEVDEKLDKIGLKQIKDKEKEQEAKRRTQPLELVIKVKERELKNAINLIAILKKDKENLEKSLNQSDQAQIVVLQDRIKEYNDKFTALENEIKALNKIKDEHQKCESVIESHSKERQQMINELKFLKDKNKDLKNKLNEGTNVKSVFITNPQQNNILPKLNNNKPSNQKKPNSDQNIHNPIISSTVNSTLDLKKFWNQLENADKRGGSPKNELGKKVDRKISLDQLGRRELSKHLNQERKKFAISLQNKNFPMLDNIEEGRSRLFGLEEREILSKLLPRNELEKLERKFDTVEQSKITLERKYTVDTKRLNKKIFDLEERLEHSHAQVKEQEQKNKILILQINESKAENKALTRKLNDVSATIKQMARGIKEKEEENKKLKANLQDRNVNKSNVNESINKTIKESDTIERDDEENDQDQDNEEDEEDEDEDEDDE